MDLNNVKELAIQGKDVFTLYVNNGLAWKKNHGFKVVAKQANSTIQLTAVGTPNAITLVKSTDEGITFSSYNVGDVITLANVGDSVILEAGPSGNTTLSNSASNYHKFVMTGKVEVDASKLNYLLNQNGQVSGSLPNYCYYSLFDGCSSLEGAIDISWFTDGGLQSLRSLLKGTGISSVNLSGFYSSSNGYVLKELCSDCTNLTSVNLDNLTTLTGEQQLQLAFNGCTSLVDVSIPKLETINGNGSINYVFKGCTSLKNVNLKKLSTTGGTNPFAEGFRYCTSLEVVDMSEATAVPAIAANTFNNTNSTFKVVVPDSLYSTWIASTNWSNISSQIIRASDYTPAS